MGVRAVRNFMHEIFMHENILGKDFISCMNISFSPMIHAHDFLMHETFRTGMFVSLLTENLTAKTYHSVLASK